MRLTTARRAASTMLLTRLAASARDRGAASLWVAGRRRQLCAAGRRGRAKSVIQIWMWGGPSHLDTFDPKPEAGYDYCGPLDKPIPTNVDGIQIGELLPLLAKQADKYSIIRSMTHGINAHETAAYMVQTGRAARRPARLPRRRRRRLAASRATTPATRACIPPYIVLTELQGRFSEAGFLGPRYTPFATGGDPAQTPFAVRGRRRAGHHRRAPARPARPAARS